MRTLIAIPCLDMCQTLFTFSLVNMRRCGETKLSMVSNSLVYDARNMLAAEAIDDHCDRVLFIDSDMAFKPDLMEKLFEDMDTGLDFVSALCFKRKLPTGPTIYKSLEVKNDATRPTGHAEAYKDYPKEQMFEIAGAGFGAVMVSTNMLKDVYDMYDFPFAPIAGALGEDLMFCWRATQLGYKMYCDSRIKVQHIGQLLYDESLYNPKGE